MKNLFRAATVIAALALSTSAYAQAAQQQRGTAANAPQIGLGVGLTAGSLTPTAGTAGAASLGYLLFVPIQVGQFRVEPFLGWDRSDTDGTGKNSDVMLGVGGFFVQPLAAQVQAYGGLRLASRWVSDQDPLYGAVGTRKHERRDTILALAGGAEYLPIPRVAVGAELQLSYASIGDTKTTTNTAAGAVSVEGGGGSGSGTQGTVFVRVYFL
jgi:hypothetical protein